jgi:erythromycin esterase
MAPYFRTRFYLVRRLFTRISVFKKGEIMRYNFLKDDATDEAGVVSVIRQKSYPFSTIKDMDPLFERIGDAKIVMLGEASHGTHEYYSWRTQISKRLIQEKGFNFIAVEGDWPDCYRLNRFIKGYEADAKTAFQVLHQFNRWPTWMWANWEVAALAEWMKKHNTGLPANKKAGFYGLDVYSLWESLDSIMQYLKKTDPAALKVAEKAFRCFEPYRKDEGRSYAHASMLVPQLCQAEVINLLKEIHQKLPQYNTDHENVFSAEQNALVTLNAEKYYRGMAKGGAESWNLRDRHMQNTLNRLLTFHGNNAKAIVWAHNTHVGDARATDMANDGMYTIGELARQQHTDKDVVLVGFGSYKGSVIAGKSWGAPMQVMPVPEAREGSWEYLLHQSGAQNKLLIMDDLKNNLSRDHIGHRAIGVVYDPGQERRGNYVPSILTQRYDAFVYIDETQAVYPLHVHPDGQQIPETYPFGT